MNRDPVALATALRDALTVARLTEAEALQVVTTVDAARRLAQLRLAETRRKV